MDIVDLLPHCEGREGPGLKNAVYGAQLEATDRAVGRVLNEIDRLGIEDNTLVVFASDNGGWDGASLKPVLQDAKVFRAPLCFHYPHYAFHMENRPGSAIRDGNYKLILLYDDDSVELYDLAADLGEEHDLAEEMPDVAARLRQRLDTWLIETDASRPTLRE